MKTAVAEQEKAPIKDFNARRSEFEAATRGVSFTKDFNPSLEALMNDPLETYVARVFAWTKRKAWGNQCLYCVNSDGSPAFQVDCVRELKIAKYTVCKAVNYLVRRGYLEMRGTAKVLYPVISPDPANTQTKGEDIKKLPAYATFLEDWKVAHSSDFAELEVARSTVERIRKVILTGYREWRALQTNPGPSLLKENSEVKEEDPTPSQPVFSEPIPEPEPEKPAGRPRVVPEDNSLKAEIRKHLEGFKIPRLTSETVNEVATHITSPELLEAYVDATAPERFKDPPRSWGLLIRIAKEVGADASRYLQTAASSPGKPLTRAEQRKQEYLRKFEREASV